MFIFFLAKMTSPESGVSFPMMMFNCVVLPAPLTPGGAALERWVRIGWAASKIGLGKARGNRLGGWTGRKLAARPRWGGSCPEEDGH